MPITFGIFDRSYARINKTLANYDRVAAGILWTTLGVGALMGWMGVLWSQGGFAPREAVHLTQEQAETLRWATSAEGKFARNLIKLIQLDREDSPSLWSLSESTTDKAKYLLINDGNHGSNWGTIGFS